MPNRILKETIWTSPNLNVLTPLAERYFYRLLPLPDDHGCFEATPLVVLGRLFPLRREVRESDIEKWNKELEAEGIVRFWVSSDRLYGVFTSWERHQRVRSLHLRKTPEPPPLDDTCRQMTADDGLNPNHNPNPLKEKERPRVAAGITPPNDFRGEFKNVYLVDDEFRKLGELLGDKRESWIERLSSYLAQIGPAKSKNYKSHYATIRNWYRMDREKQTQLKSGGGNGTGTYRKSYFSRDAKDLAASEEAERINREWRSSKNTKGKTEDHP